MDLQTHTASHSISAAWTSVVAFLPTIQDPPFPILNTVGYIQNFTDTIEVVTATEQSLFTTTELAEETTTLEATTLSINLRNAEEMTSEEDEVSTSTILPILTTEPDFEIDSLIVEEAQKDDSVTEISQITETTMAVENIETETEINDVPDNEIATDKHDDLLNMLSEIEPVEEEQNKLY